MKLNWSCIIPLPFQPLDLIILLNLVVVHAIVKKVLYHNDIFSVHGLWKKKKKKKTGSTWSNQASTFKEKCHQNPKRC